MGYFETLSIANDLLVVWGLDTATLKVEGQSDVALTKCVLDEPVDTKEMEAAAGQVPQQDVLKIWPTSFSPKPPLGSVIVDSLGVYWTILSIRYKNMVECWEAHCRNLSILPSTMNIATILKAQFVRGQANEAKAKWLGINSGVLNGTVADQVPCRFQLVGEDAFIRFNSEWVRETYRCILQNSIPIEMAGGEYRLIDLQGNRYRITNYYQEQRIDVLSVAICVRIIEGVEYFSATPTPLPMPPFPQP